MEDPVLPFMQPLVLLAAAVVAVPLFKRLGLGSVLGYLVAGLIVGPTGVALVTESDSLHYLAEFGIVLLLFLIGLELHPSRLWSMRRDIFGLGTAQLVITGALLAPTLWLFGLGPRGAVVAGLALALSSTAFALQILQEHGQMSLPFGRRAFAILLLQDLAIVPLLMLIELLSPRGVEDTALSMLIEVGFVALAVIVVFVTGRFILNPVFTLLARSDAREIMTAAGLLVVLGAAVLMAAVGMSMAMGAFLAGVLLSESNFRMTLEADLEPFRGLLLGLFFMGVGMTVNIDLVLANFHWVALLTVVVVGLKGGVLYAASRFYGSRRADAFRIAAVLPQGGEFGFVIFAAAVAAGVLTQTWAAVLNAVVIVSMAMTPVIVMVFDRIVLRLRRRGVRPETAESFEDARARVIIVGYGRFGSMVDRMMREEGIEVVALDQSADRIRAAARLGQKVYYGDGTRAETLRSAGAGEARLIALCMHDRVDMRKAITVIREHFPHAALFCRAVDRLHAAELVAAGVDFQIREVFESGVVFAREALASIGISSDRVREIEEAVRNAEAETVKADAARRNAAAAQPAPVE